MTRSHIVWVTTQVLPIAGWVNVFDEPNGDPIITTCPALLLQEWRETETPVNAKDGETDWNVQQEDPPYATRVVAAEFIDTEFQAANESSNYSYSAARADLDKYKPHLAAVPSTDPA